MKNQINFSGTSNVLFFGVFIFTLFTFAKPNNVGVIDHYKVGDVVYSVLKPDEFMQLHGSSWTLMDGRAIDQQFDLRRMFGWTNVPDARGLFLRSMNLGRDKATGDAGADNLNNRVVGSYQDDILKLHSHLQDENYNVALRLFQNSDPYGTIRDSDRSTNEPVLLGDNKKIVPFGGAETRPRNIALYTYIKINEQ